MPHKYDHILIATSQIEHDRRMDRICHSLLQQGSVLLIGRGSQPVGRSYDTLTYQCRANSGVLFYEEVLFRLIGILRGYRWETLTCVDLDTILVGRYFRLFRSFRWVFDSHEYFSEVPELRDKPVKKWIWSRIGRLCIPRTDTRITVGEALAKQLEQKYNKPFEVVRNLPERLSEIFHTDHRKDREETILVYLGVLNEGRGLEQMISALGALPDYHLWIIGEGDLSATLRAQVDSLDYSDRIRFYGMLAEDDFVPLLRQADIGLNLLTPLSLSYYYSLANKFHDYLSYGLPVLTMRFPEYEAVISREGCGWMIDALSANEIVDRLSSLTKADILSVKAAAWEYGSGLSWEQEGEKLLEIYKS